MEIEVLFKKAVAAIDGNEMATSDQVIAAAHFGVYLALQVQGKTKDATRYAELLKQHYGRP